MVIFEARFGCQDILILSKSPIKWRHCPNITIAVEWDVNHQFKQTNGRSGLGTVARFDHFCMDSIFRFIMHAVWSAPTTQIFHARSLISTNYSDLSCTQSDQSQQFRFIMHAVWSAPTTQIYHASSLISTNYSDLSCTQSDEHQLFRFIMHTV